MKTSMLLSGIASVVFSYQSVMAAELSLASFPDNVRATGEAVMEACAEAGNSLQPLSTSIQDIHLKDGTHLAVFDPAGLCSRRFKANGACTTDGCDVYALREAKPGSWEIVYSQQVTDFDVALESSIKPLRLSVNLRGGVAPCDKARSGTCTVVMEWAGSKFIAPNSVGNAAWEGLWANNKDQCSCRTGTIDQCVAGKGLPPLKINSKNMIAPELSCDIVKVTLSDATRFDMTGKCSSEGSEGTARITGVIEDSKLTVAINPAKSLHWSQGSYTKFIYKCN